MKKCLSIVLFGLMATTANAGWHYEDGCAIDVRFLARDFYYFCGAHEARCNGDWAEPTELKNGFVKWYDNGEAETFNGTHHWCCGGKVDRSTLPTARKGKASGTPGKWVKGKDWFVKTETKTKTVAGGTCSYLVKTDICGNVHSEEDTCKTAKVSSDGTTSSNVSCPDGQYFRVSSKSCAKLCDSGWAYESAKSNTCVECPENLTQGIVSDTGVNKKNTAVDPEHKICLKCNPSTQFFNSVTRECVTKSSLTALSVADLQGKTTANNLKKEKVSDQCWTKSGSEYQDCISAGSGKRVKTQYNGGISLESKVDCSIIKPLCTSTSGSSMEVTLDKPNGTTIQVGSKNCWCGVGGELKWIYARKYDDRNACEKSCNTYCSSMLKGSASASSKVKCQ